MDYLPPLPPPPDAESKPKIIRVKIICTAALLLELAAIIGFLVLVNLEVPQDQKGSMNKVYWTLLALFSSLLSCVFGRIGLSKLRKLESKHPFLFLFSAVSIAVPFLIILMVVGLVLYWIWYVLWVVSGL